MKPFRCISKDYKIILIEIPVQSDLDNESKEEGAPDESNIDKKVMAEEILQYNRIVQSITDEPGFINFFIKNNLLVTRKQLEEHFSCDLADLVFSMPDLRCPHQLHVSGDFVFDPGFEFSENLLVIENHFYDPLDVSASYSLCLQLEKDGLIPEDDDYNWFYNYEQEKDDIERPDGRVTRALELLESKGYATKYYVNMNDRESEDHYVYVIDLNYIKNRELVSQIQKVLRSGVFGYDSGKVQTYALIRVSAEDWNAFCEDVYNNDGKPVDAYDSTGSVVVLNLSCENIMKIAAKFSIDDFIFGEDYVPSTPCYYKRNEGEYISVTLESVTGFDEFEDIAPKLNEEWEDLNFLDNNFFLEALWNAIGLW